MPYNVFFKSNYYKSKNLCHLIPHLCHLIPHCYTHQRVILICKFFFYIFSVALGRGLLKKPNKTKQNHHVKRLLKSDIPPGKLYKEDEVHEPMLS